MKESLGIKQVSLVLFGAPLAAALLMAAILCSLIQATESSRQVAVKQSVISAAVVRLQSLYYEAGFNYFLYATTGAAQSLTRYHQDRVEIVQIRKWLPDAIATEPKEREIYEQLAPLLSSTDDYLQMEQDFSSDFSITDRLVLINRVTKLERVAGALVPKFALLTDVARNLSAKADSNSSPVAWFLYSCLFIDVVIAFILIFIYTKTFSSRLGTLVEHTRLIGADLPLAECRDRSNDELGQLDLVMHDLSRKMRVALQKERALFEHSGDAICILDRAGRVTRLNPSAAKLWENDRSAVVGTRLVEYLNQADGEQLYEILKDSSQNQTRNVRWSFQSASASDPVITRWSIACNPATESFICIVRNESRLTALEHAREKYLETLSRMLKQPFQRALATIDELDSGLIKRVGDDPARTKLTVIRNNLNRLSQLIDKLEIESGPCINYELIKEPVNLPELLLTCNDSVSSATSRKNISFETDFIDVSVPGDRLRLFQVFLNLIVNAVKFSPVHERVKISIAIGETRMVTVSISDRGPGIEKKDLDKVFEPFAQTAEGISANSAGVGLGLAIVKQIVDMHGGNVAVVDGSPTGSRFQVELPLDQDQ